MTIKREVKISSIWSIIGSSARMLLQIALIAYIYFDLMKDHDLVLSVLGSVGGAQVCMMLIKNVLKAFEFNPVEVTEYEEGFWGDRIETGSYTMQGIPALLFNFFRELMITLAVVVIALIVIEKQEEGVPRTSAMITIAAIAAIPMLIDLWNMIMSIRFYLSIQEYSKIDALDPQKGSVYLEQTVKPLSKYCKMAPPVLCKCSPGMIPVLMVTWPLRVILGGLGSLILFALSHAYKLVMYAFGGLTGIFAIAFLLTKLIPDIKEFGYTVTILTEYWREFLVTAVGIGITAGLYFLQELIEGVIYMALEHVDDFRYGII